MTGRGGDHGIANLTRTPLEQHGVRERLLAENDARIALL